MAAGGADYGEKELQADEAPAPSAPWEPQAGPAAHTPGTGTSPAFFPESLALSAHPMLPLGPAFLLSALEHSGSGSSRWGWGSGGGGASRRWILGGTQNMALVPAQLPVDLAPALMSAAPDQGPGTRDQAPGGGGPARG